MLAWLVLRPAGIVTLILGAITLPTPLPTGILLIGLGTALLIATSATVRIQVRRLRARFPRLDRALEGIEPRLVRWLAVPLRRTRPIRRRATRATE
ncbi:hypothetical protein EDC22_107127 [Tepidamorphus gemmatus]|uniref:Uncharacterized protein n=1 Tax=Tepidamorphus gemmatus TaxID=747076 RepID=A0A4R3M7G5_9HYPH|nr:hypothetical protein [Tepidamorphus gemmatus]TCT09280.1 hypothetical protein EDC22_107127 [Tepidamorphus gemmatus]